MNQTGEGRGGLLGLLAGLARQPLLQFAAIGALLFVLLGDGRAAPDDAVILVDPPLRERLSRQFEAQLGAYPSQEEMQALVDKHVRDEMLYREALRLGLDQGDEIVRRRLVQKMEFLAESAVPPSEEELRAWFGEHRGDFGEPARATIRQVYFSPDRDGWDGARARAAAALAKGVRQGDAFTLDARYADLDPQAALRLFGDSELTGAIQTAPAGEWSGPYRSGYGWHLLLVESREETGAPSFEEAREQAALRWSEENRTQQLDALMGELRARYRVETVQ